MFKVNLNETGKRIATRNKIAAQRRQTGKEVKTMYDNEPEYIVKLQSETIERAIKIVEKIKEKHPNAKIRIEVEL